MDYRRLGSSGLLLSALSFGAWQTFGKQIPRNEARNLVAAAWDHGVNFFDNAEVYAFGEAEQVMGDVIADLRLPRDGFVVSSKAFFGAVREPAPTQHGLSRKHLFDACHAAIRRLRVDYLDLFYCHRPDPQVPMAEIVSTMDMLIRQGKVLYWGTSEWPAEAIREAHAVAHAGGFMAPVMEQPEYNLLQRDRFEQEYAPLYAEFGMGTTTWSPLASGLLTGKYADGIPEGSRLADPNNGWLRDEADTRMARAARFTSLANEAGMAPAPLAIAWILRNPNVSTVILGASHTGQLLQNFEALELLPRITPELAARLDAL